MPKKEISFLVKQRPQRDDPNEWVSTFADMTTLLLTFFIMLVAISTPNATSFEQVKAGMAKSLGKREIQTPIEQVRKEMEQVLKELKVEDKVGLASDSQGIVLEFAAASFFAPGSAEITETAVPVFNKVAATLLSDRYLGFQIEVQGHTDDEPISTPQYPSNWELSAGRASSVVRLMVGNGIEGARMRAVGLADTAPKVPNRGPYGDALPQNQEINRRVAVRIYPR